MDFIKTPRQAFQGEEFQVCAMDVRSQVTPKVYLKENGEIIDSRNAKGDVCFDVTKSEKGKHRYTVGALAGNQRTSTSKDLQVYKADSETKNFPDRIASVRSESGIVKATVYNMEHERKTYDLSLEGVPDDWFSQTEKQVIVQPGEEREVFFYVTPKQDGEFETELEVENGGETLHEQTVQVRAVEPHRHKNFLQRLKTLLF